MRTLRFATAARGAPLAARVSRQVDIELKGAHMTRRVDRQRERVRAHVITAFLRAVRCQLLAMAAAFLPLAAAAQNCGWSHIDHRINYDASGAWDPKTYRGVEALASVAQVGAALWLGAEQRLGRTAWQGIDSELLAAAGAAVGKRVFTRTRPSVEDNPCLWFQGGGHYSFPSEEPALMAGLVTPYMLEYGPEHPAVYGLVLLPLYVGAGRIKNQAHWQTDVLAGWAIGGAAGTYAHSRDVPLAVRVLPHGLTVGWRHSF